MPKFSASHFIFQANNSILVSIVLTHFGTKNILVPLFLYACIIKLLAAECSYLVTSLAIQLPISYQEPT